MRTDGADNQSSAGGLGASARSALLWGSGFTLGRDVAQFAVMLMLVRLLSPADYGTAALAQSILGFVSVASFATVSLHALQSRDPSGIDWQAHFTAAAVINLFAFCFTLAVAWGLSHTTLYREAAWPLAALSVTFLVDVPSSLRQRMLESGHDWPRFRALLMLGTLLGLGFGLLLGILGWGIWALVVQVPLFGLPAAIDLFVKARFRPDWTWSIDRYRDALDFGMNRMFAGALGRGRVLSEQVALSSSFDLAALGIFSRAIGLGTLLAGRIGATAMMSLYPVITRAERGSDRFRRLSSLVMSGVCWTTVPVAAFLGLAASDIVHLLYGPKWQAVVPLLPLAAAVVGLGGIVSALASLLLASDEARASVSIDLLSAICGIGLAFTIVPYGAIVYLAGLAAATASIAVAAVVMLMSRRVVEGRDVVKALLPPAVAAFAGAAALVALREVFGVSQYVVVRLAVDGHVFAFAYVATLRIGFATPLAELVDVLPAGRYMARGMRLEGRTA